MEKTLVFIDCGFLSKVSKHFGGGTPLRYDLLKFSKNITGKEDLVFKHLFFYTAPPFQSSKPNKNEKVRKQKYDSFIKKLSIEDCITIRSGRCQRVKKDGKYVYKQKGVDTLLTMDLMQIPIKHNKIKTIILIASDSDFVPVIKELENMGIKTILYTYFDRKRGSMFSTSNQLLKSVSKFVQIKGKDFKN